MSSRIRHLNVELTRRCNQRCFYCFNNSGGVSRTGELQLEAWLAILGDLRSKGLQSVHFTGGEPFLYERITELLEAAQLMGLSTSILSNGFRIAEVASRFQSIISLLAVAQISLDSMNPAVHNQRRGYFDAWVHSMSAIRALCEISVPVEVSCVVDDDNIRELPAIARFCDQLQCGLILRPLVAQGRASE